MLIVTIHDVAPPHLAAVQRLRELVGGWGVPATTLLAIPDHHGAAPLRASPTTRAWLRRRAELGDEIALHGITHRQDAPATRWRDRLRAGLLTAGEGEMLGAGAGTPARLIAARVGLEDVVGRAIPGFVAPAWLEPRGLATVLRKIGFSWHEDATMVERLSGTPTRWRTPVIGFATRSRWRETAALAWAAAVAPLLDAWASHTGAPMRIALHPADLSSPAVMRAIERVIVAAVPRHRPVTTSAALGCA